jgi:preprotein translocase subunit SecA
MFLYIARKVFGTRNDRVLRSLQPLVHQVNESAQHYKDLSDGQLQAQTPLLRERLERGESLESLEPEAFALVREVASRVLGMRHFDVQLIGGAVLHRGMIAEMKTGEGKTLMATLPAFLNGLTGNGVHVVTVNDYLAKRDAEWMGRVYNFLGLSVGVVYPGLSEEEKRRAYRADITYGQNNEFGFDYLRDNMKYSLDQMFQRRHHFAIVDEVDSILIDEARTPLIISGPIDESTDKYYEINKIIPYLEKDIDFEIELRTKNPTLTDEGVAKAEKLLGIDNLFDPSHIEILHHVNQALKAHTTLERDVDYVVKDGQIIIVDEFTGRLMVGRRWSNGLHQAVEAKEQLKIARENQTLASITFQNYFRMYEKLSGMTGTADTEAVEFKQIYNLEVVVIPTNRPMQRQDLSDVVFRTRQEKIEAVVQDIAEIHKTGQPILVGTISIEQSENLSRHLSKLDVRHNVLNAKQHEKEAEIVAQAGRFGAVTISTNMAGRGTDIVLGGNPGALAFAETGTKDPEDVAYQEALTRYKRICEDEKKRVLEVGGLAIIGTERHESRRIDNQLRGRAGRQGDPGASRFYVSLEDDLMLRFGGERIQQLMNRLGWDDGMPMDGRMISRSIETAQKRVEGMHFESRKHVTEYDDVMNKQRQVIYNLRNRILSDEGVRQEIMTMIDDILEEVVVQICDDKVKAVNWDIEELKQKFQYLFNQSLNLNDDRDLSQQTLFDALRDQAHEIYQQNSVERNGRLDALRRLSEQEDSGVTFHGPIPSFEEIEQRTILESVDYFWNAHLQAMDELREGIGLRGYGQKNPLYEYQREGFLLFQRTMGTLKEAVVRRLYYEEVVDVQTLLAALEEEAERRETRERQMQMVHEGTEDEDDDTSLDSESALDGDVNKDPDLEKARREALRKERRKKRR